MKQNKIKKTKRGISLIVLIITIIVVIILAAAVILTISRDGGIINKARYAKDEYNKIEYKDRINEAYTIVKNKQEMQGKTAREIFEEVKKSLNFEKAKYEISEKSMNITTKEGYEYTLTGDGNIYDEKVAILDIAEGNIDLYSTGYKQYTGNLQNLNKNDATTYTGKYIITGTTTENVVRVCDEGKYDITIKDLNMNMSDKTPMVCNAKSIANNVFVYITLEGDNYLTTQNGPALSFNIGYNEEEAVVNRSTIIFNGNGHLTIKLNGNYQLGSALGSSYGGSGIYSKCKANFIINSGTFDISSGHCGDALGAGLRGSGFNITINGGDIIARGGEYSYGIGSNGNLIINGGRIETTRSYNKDSISGEDIKITGGTIKVGGNKGFVKTPTDGDNTLCKTSIKLQGLEKDKQVTKLTTSDNIEYGIKDMYTLEGGMLYMYLPLGKREITIKVDGKTFKGEVETKEEENVTVLNQI